MKIQVRRGVFETNSSSVHSLCICSADDYDKWKNGELFYDLYNDVLIEDSDEIQQSRKECEEEGYLNNYVNYDEYLERLSYFDTYVKSYKSKSGDDIVAFGYYGHDSQ